MPFYYFFKRTMPPDPSGWVWLETCEDHKEAAEKERAYRALTLERGDPVVRRVHATTQDEAHAIIEKYGPKEG